ncbi:MAG TPA: ABC transporter ATP-binding protein [Streptosporangiaceae bacterium]|jgi:ABC-type glutathione transport system ATPase component
MNAPAVPAAGVAGETAVLAFEDVRKLYRGRPALDGVSLALAPGTTLGLVGESGSGKTTCVRLALGLERPTSGRLTFGGTPYPRGRRAMRPIRSQIGFVLQDPYDSLDPRMTLRQIVAEPLRARGRAGGRPPGGRGDPHETGHAAGGTSSERNSEVMAAAGVSDERISEVLAAAGLPGAPLDSYPARYSGGGRQRIAIARALIGDPALLICDEPTSSLDVSVQAQIVNLLLAARQQRDLSMLFVSHDLDLIGRVADTLAVMYAGQVVETGPAALIRDDPRHPYTRALHDAIPAAHPAQRRLAAGPADTAGSVRAAEATEVSEAGEVDARARAGAGGTGAAPGGRTASGRVIPALAGAASCVFAERCPRVQPRCRAERPLMITEAEGRTYACFHPILSSSGQTERTSTG